MKGIQPCLWFDNQAEEAAQFYTSVFPNSRIVQTSHYGEGMQLPAGTVLTVGFELDGQPFMALNGGPLFKFSEAISLMVNCDTQAELDALWAKLTADGGKEVQCGWLKDKYGLSWQIVPASFGKLMEQGTPDQKQRALAVVMKMVKLDIAAIEAAYYGTT